jgi:hypothetical protein
MFIDGDTSVLSTSSSPSGAFGTGLLMAAVVTEWEIVIGTDNPSDSLSLTG